jgi:hypothetical protein
MSSEAAAELLSSTVEPGLLSLSGRSAGSPAKARA